MSKLFDDESDGEYEAQPVAEVSTPVQEQTQSDDYQQQPAAQESQQQQEEYNPYVADQVNQEITQQQPAADYNPYAEPETAQIETKEEVHQPPAEYEHPNEHPEEKSAHTAADTKVHDAADKAKSELISQISQFNQVSEQSGLGQQESFEAADASTHLFSVTNPQKIGSVVKYTVTGQDSEKGNWQTSRRYNEFFILHNVLNERWPGCFIPCIPEKSILGDKEDGFIEERRSLLNRFILECSKFEFIINSDEFKIFALQQAGEVGPALENMKKQRPAEILARYRIWFKIDENLDNSELSRFREKINNFNQFLNKAVLAMQKDRLMLTNAAAQYQKSFDHYANVYKQFMQYEDSAVEFFGNNDQQKKILTNEASGDFANKLKDTVALYKSPFAEGALWIKGEMLDIQGMIDAIKGRENVMKKQINFENKRRDDQEELEKLSLGKATMKSFFKSKSGKEADILALQTKIEQANVDIEEYRRLINFITIYHGNLAIDKFKKQKIEQYKKMLQNMATRSINNSYLAATLNSGILQTFEQLKV